MNLWFEIVNGKLGGWVVRTGAVLWVRARVTTLVSSMGKIKPCPSYG